MARLRQQPFGSRLREQLQPDDGFAADALHLGQVQVHIDVGDTAQINIPEAHAWMLQPSAKWALYAAYVVDALGGEYACVLASVAPAEHSAALN